MPFETLRIVPSVDIEKTLADNAAGISYSNFIRWRDKIPEKRGGSKYFNGSSATYGVVRALHVWQGLNNYKFLAIGSTTGLYVYYTDNSSWFTKTITPQKVTVDILPDNYSLYPAGTYSSIGKITSSDIVRVYNSSLGNISTFDSVVFNTQASVPPVIGSSSSATYFGSFIPSKGYKIQSLSSGQYYTIPNGIYPPAQVNNGLVPYFTTTNGSAVIRADLQGQTYEVGDAVDFNVSTTVGGVVIYGRYIVTESVKYDGTNYAAAPVAPNPPTATCGYFKFNAATAATSTTSGYMNGGYLNLTYWDALAPGTSPISGSTAITATDWWFDNWGEEIGRAHV